MSGLIKSEKQDVLHTAGVILESAANSHKVHDQMIILSLDAGFVRSLLISTAFSGESRLVRLKEDFV